MFHFVVEMFYNITTIAVTTVGSTDVDNVFVPLALYVQRRRKVTSGILGYLHTYIITCQCTR